ncbi:MAG: nickel pincer cofactor biosynthesis protein LarB [Halobacteriaceae archaeon]
MDQDDPEGGDSGAGGDDVDAVLEALARGDLSVAEAKERVRGVGRVGEFARVDARQGERTGIPEVVEAERKTDEEVVGIGRELLDSAGHAVLTGVSDSAREELEGAAADSEFYERSRTLLLHAADYEPPERRGRVGVVTAGTSDIAVAEQAAALATEMGCAVETVYDVGVSAIHRLLAEREALDACDAVVVAAGREGALATVVAGLVSAPVIGLPVGTGSGYGGDGEAALMGMLQSCTYLTVVNIDAGFVAGGQAALIAR